MGRNSLKYMTATFIGGINQDPQTGAFQAQCADARNVWALDGGVQPRPGSEFMFHSGVQVTPSVPDDVTNATQMYKSVSGVTTNQVAGVLDLANMQIEDMVYIGWATLPTTAEKPLISQIKLYFSALNSNATRARWQYWNGVDWKGIELHNVNEQKLGVSFASVTAQGCMFAIPTDWATSTEAYGGAVYWLRAVLKDAAIDAACATDLLPVLSVPNGPSGGLTDATRATFRSTWASMIGNYPIFGSFWLSYADNTTTLKSGYLVGLRGIGQGVVGITHSASSLGAPTSFYLSEPVTATALAYNDAIYVALPGGIYKLDKTNYITNSNYQYGSFPALAPAAVETDPLIVGVGVPGAPYDTSLVAQFGSFPIAKYVSFFQNRFWFSGIEGNPQIVQWGAAAPSHLVLPGLNFEDVIENSGQAISGQAPLGANMIIYKPDSIHKMIYTGLNSFSEATFVPETMVKGAGCVSNASIADVNGTHVFLSSRGLMQFDGQNARYVAQRQVDGELSDRLQDIWPKLSAGRFPFAVGVHWKAKHCYLLAASYKGSSTNNLIIVWDYLNDALWLWDGLDVAGWFFEDADQTTLCYSDSYGRYFRLAGGTDFGTAIDAYVTTQRLGYDSAFSSSLRLMELLGDNDSDQLSVQFYNTDNEENSGALTFLDPLESVYGTGRYGTATYGATKPRYKRIGVWQVGRNHQVKLSQNTKNAWFRVESMKLGYLQIGKR